MSTTEPNAAPAPEWAGYAETLGMTDKATPVPPPACRCAELAEPCSPDCFETAGFRRGYFADFVAAWRNMRDGEPPIVHHGPDALSEGQFPGWPQ